MKKKLPPHALASDMAPPEAEKLPETLSASYDMRDTTATKKTLEALPAPPEVPSFLSLSKYKSSIEIPVPSHIHPTVGSSVIIGDNNYTITSISFVCSTSSIEKVLFNLN